MSKVKSLILGLSAALAFTIVAAILLKFMRQPFGATDAMVIGALATIAAMVVLFVGYMFTTNQRDIFFKRRPRK